MIVLVPIDANGDDGVPLQFDQTHIHVGRGPHNDLVLDSEDQTASYEHAEIVVHENRAVVVCDLTANPTYIDGADITLAPEDERQLKPGDIVSFGKGKSVYRVNRVGEFAEPRRSSREQARGPSQTSKGGQDGRKRKSSSSPPPLARKDAGQDRAGCPITFQVFKGDRMVREETLDQPIIRIGRMKSSHLLLDDESVSRTHAVIEVSSEEEVLLLDLDSSSGTAVNGNRVKKAILKSGDQIEFGQARVTISYGTKFVPSSTEVLSLDQLEMLESPRVIIRRGGEQQGELTLTKPCTTIGRLPQNDIHLDDGAVSGKHAMLVVEDGVFLIIDQKSTNGTFLNGEKCVGESLRNGDIIQIGHFEIEFVAPKPLFGMKPPGTAVLTPEAAQAMLAMVSGRRDKKS